ncbi:hypothetical protein SCUP515_06971 [Seiridium cupressi]
MGKLNAKSDGPPADAVSLHTNPGDNEGFLPYHDEDAPELNVDALDELPPVYSDALASSSSAAPPVAIPTHPQSSQYSTYLKDANTGAEFYIDSRLESPPELEKHIRFLATKPPRPYIKIIGTHQASKKKSDGKTENVTVTDFYVSIELTPYLYSNAQYGKSWTQLRTADNGENVRRGTVLKKRAPGSKQDLEVGGGPKPTLEEWCHRFCASHAGLKTFTLQRQMTGFDFPKIKQELHSLVRSTNYRGHLEISLDTKDASVEIYNDARINRWRMISWLRFLFAITLLFIFSWPYLFFRTKRWEVAVAEWPFSRMADGSNREYVSISEDQWYNMWARAIMRAVLEKRQKVLDQADLRRAQEPDPSFESGNATVDSAVGFFRAASVRVVRLWDTVSPTELRVYDRIGRQITTCWLERFQVRITREGRDAGKCTEIHDELNSFDFRQYAKTHTPMPFIPEFPPEAQKPRVIVLACCDARVNPEAALGLKPGADPVPHSEAIVIRNAGCDVPRNMADILLLSHVRPDIEELLIIQHNDCGVTYTTDEAIREGIKTVAPDHVEQIDNLSFGTFQNNLASVEERARKSVNFIKASPFIKRELAENTVGAVYDIKTVMRCRNHSHNRDFFVGWSETRRLTQGLWCFTFLTSIHTDPCQHGHNTSCPYWPLLRGKIIMGSPMPSILSPLPKGISHCENVAPLNSSEVAAEAAKQHFDLPKSVGTYGDSTLLAEDPHIDLVVCNSRVDVHFSGIEPSVKAGKAVYVGWPLSENLQRGMGLPEIG